MLANKRTRTNGQTGADEQNRDKRHNGDGYQHFHRHPDRMATPERRLHCRRRRGFMCTSFLRNCLIASLANAVNGHRWSCYIVYSSLPMAIPNVACGRAHGESIYTQYSRSDAKSRVALAPLMYSPGRSHPVGGARGWTTPGTASIPNTQTP